MSALGPDCMASFHHKGITMRNYYVDKGKVYSQLWSEFEGKKISIHSDMEKNHQTDRGNTSIKCTHEKSRERKTK